MNMGNCCGMGAGKKSIRRESFVCEPGQAKKFAAGRRKLQADRLPGIRGSALSLNKSQIKKRSEFRNEDA